MVQVIQANRGSDEPRIQNLRSSSCTSSDVTPRRLMFGRDAGSRSSTCPVALVRRERWRTTSPLFVTAGATL